MINNFKNKSTLPQHTRSAEALLVLSLAARRQYVPTLLRELLLSESEGMVERTLYVEPADTQQRSRINTSDRLARQLQSECAAGATPRRWEGRRRRRSSSSLNIPECFGDGRVAGFKTWNNDFKHPLREARHYLVAAAIKTSYPCLPLMYGPCMFPRHRQNVTAEMGFSLLASSARERGSRRKSLRQNSCTQSKAGGDNSPGEAHP